MYDALYAQNVFNSELERVGLTRSRAPIVTKFTDYAKTKIAPTDKMYGSVTTGLSPTPISRGASLVAGRKLNIQDVRYPKLEKGKPIQGPINLATSDRFTMKAPEKYKPTPVAYGPQAPGVNAQSQMISNAANQAAGITSLATGGAGLAAGAAATLGTTTGAAIGGAVTAGLGGGVIGTAAGTAVQAATAVNVAAAGAAGGGATLGLAAVLGPLAIAAFAVMAISSINAAKQQRKALKKAQKAEADKFRTKVAMFQNREKLENLVLTDTLNQVERQAVKSRAELNVAKGETLSGNTYNTLQLAHRRNELEYKERLKSRSVQKRIAMREQLVVDYHATRVRMESIADQNPSNADIALGIIGSGLQTAMGYYSAVGDPSMA